jgi:hypothetical protein
VIPFAWGVLAGINLNSMSRYRSLSGNDTAGSLRNLFKAVEVALNWPALSHTIILGRPLDEQNLAKANRKESVLVEVMTSIWTDLVIEQVNNIK